MHRLLQRTVSFLLALYLILGSYKGYIALFEEGKSEPRQIFPTPVTSLPPEDQKMLEEGILVRSQYRLQQLLEDYLS